MKKTLLICLAAALSLSPVPAEDLEQQLRRAAEKLKNEITKVREQAGVKEQGGTKGREWSGKAGGNPDMAREEYLKKSGDALSRWQADIAVLKEQGGRDYFKTRVKALEEHHAWAVKEREVLDGITDEAQFRARQKSFGKTLWTLEAAVEQAQEEAGL